MDDRGKEEEGGCVCIYDTCLRFGGCELLVVAVFDFDE